MYQGGIIRMADNNSNNNIASEDELTNCINFLVEEIRLLQVRVDRYDEMHHVIDDVFKKEFIIRCQGLQTMYAKILKILLKVREVQQNESE